MTVHATGRPGGGRRRLMQAVLVLCLCVPLLTGCWDQLSIEERATILAIAIDKVSPETAQENKDVTHSSTHDPIPDKPGVRLTVQIAVPGRVPLGVGEGGGGQEKSPVWIVSVVGHTIQSAFADLQQEIADEVFLGHLRVIVVSEQVARDGLGDLSDVMRRNPEIRRTVRLAVSGGDPGKLIQSAPPLERVPALYLKDMLTGATELGKFPTMSLGRFWAYDSAPGREPFLPYLQLGKNGDVKLQAMAYFKGDKMVGMIEPLKIDNYMTIMGSKFGGYTYLQPLPDTKDGYYAFRVTDRRAIRKVSIKNGRPAVTLRLFYEGEIVEIVGASLTEQLMRKMEKQMQQDGFNNNMDLIKRTQKHGADIFAFGENVRGKLHGYWNKHVCTKDKWREIYKELPIDMKVKLQIRRIGAMDK